MNINYIYKKAGSERKNQNKEFKKIISDLISFLGRNEKAEFGSINLVFCNDKIIREYNLKYLRHDYETDIITFYDRDEEDQTEAELLISVETVRSNSVRFNTTYERELYRVIIHGILHLCGYKDKTKKQKEIMKKKENYYLNLI